MSISQELRRAGPYVSDGSTKAFTFSFKVMKGSDLSVVVADNKDTSVSETLASTNYTVTLNDNQENSPGGTVTLNNALPSGKALAIISNAPFLQEKVFTNAGGFYPEVLNDALDTLTIYCQQLKEAIGRCLIIPGTSEHTPQEVLAEVLEIASTANDYAQQALEIYNSVSEDVAEIKALKAKISEMMVTFQTIEALAAQAQANANSTLDDKNTCQQILQQVQTIAAQSGFSFRASATVSAGDTFPLSNLTPSAYAKTGDLVLNTANGDVFQITAVTVTTATVGSKVTSLKGPRGERGLQGEPGPQGSPGEQGPMGQSPFATCFGQFRVNTNGVLQLEYVGLAPAQFSINDNGEVEATYGDA